MTSLVSALLAVALLSMLFAGTRAIGIVCLVIVCYLNPLVSAGLFVLAITIVLYILK